VSIGVGMGKGMYDWMAAAFNNAFVANHGSVTSADFKNKAQSRIDFEEGLITEVAVPKLSGDSKEALYFDVSFEAERVRHGKAKGEDISAQIGKAQKAWLCSNYYVEIGHLPCKRVASIEPFSWKCAVTPDLVGAFNEPTKHPCKVDVPNIKLNISMGDYDEWADYAAKWFVGGERAEDTDEMQGRIVFLKPDMKTEIGEIELQQVGLVSFKKDDMEANAEKIARFTAELYVEKMLFKIKEYDA